MKLATLAALLLILSGCTTVALNAEKTVAVKPSDKAMTAKANTTCKDYVFFHRCWLNVDIQPVN